MKRIASQWQGKLIYLFFWAIMTCLPVVALAAGPLDHFGINDLSGAKTAGVGFPIVITAYDSSGNTVTSITGNTTFELIQVSTPITSTNGAWSVLPAVTSGNFVGGVFTGTMTIYRAGTNYDVRADNDSASFAGPTTTTHDFTVNINTMALRYLFIMPGETYRPGEDYGVGYGHEGMPADITAGTYTSVSLYVTDLYGNRDATYNNFVNISLLRIDAGSTLVNPVTITAGLGWEDMVLTTAYSGSNQQQLQSSGGTPLPLPSSLFNVLPNVLDHFSVGNIGPTETAGVAASVFIAARDTYDNLVTSFTGPVYVTCPNLDYHDPEQSVMNIPTYGTVTGVTWTVGSGFSAGVWSHDVEIFRVGNPVTLSVSDQPDGTGHTGVSSVFQVDPGTHTKVFLTVPGVECRPGVGGGAGNSLGGYAGSPDAQVPGTPFSVTAYATDAWWNPVSDSGALTMYTSPSTSNIHGTNWDFNNGNTVMAVVLNDVDSYQLAADYTSGGIADYSTPYNVSSQTLNRFEITSPDGTGGPIWPLPDPVTAGVPLTISITAYADAGSTVATTFNGQVNLVTSVDHEEPYRIISPQQITFTQGFWTGTITLYRAAQNVAVSCQLGTVPSNVPNNPTVVHGSSDRLLLLTTGMDEKPGIAPDVYPVGFLGYTGSPAIAEAGEAFDFRIHVCDQYYNVVTTTADGGTDAIQITASDPYPGTMGTMAGDFQSLPQTVNVGPYTVNSPQDPGYPYGAFRTTNFRLYSVGVNGYQTITATDVTNGGVTSFTLGGGGVPPINVRHNVDVAQFQVDVASSPKTAGVPFASTITAQDAFGNMMDDRNGATAFPPSNNVILSAGSGLNTLWPTYTQLPLNGVGYSQLTLYKEYVGNSVTASFSDPNGTHRGTSAAMTVNSNTFARLIPSIPNMDVTNGGGRYYGANPGTGFIGYSGSPIVQTAGSAIGGFNVYACDLYGNIAEGPTDLVYITTTDGFAPLPRPVALNNISGQAAYNGANSFAFHTAAESSQGDTPFTITAYDVLQTIQGVTRTASATDPLGTIGVIDVIQIVNTATATAFIKNWDYRQVGDTIEWLVNAPNVGNLYQVYWVYANPSGISGGTTPGIYVNPSAPYGLATLAPGQVLVEGAGNSNMASGIGGVTPGGWYSGVTLTHPIYGVAQNSFAAFTWILGAPFSVTVVATDQFGNEVSSNDNYELRTNDADPLSEPDVGTPLLGTLVAGRDVLECKLFNFGSQGNNMLWPIDTTTPAMDHGIESRTDIFFISMSQMFFKVWVNGVESPGPVTITAAPDTFTVKVEVRDDISLQIVQTANINFIMEAVLNPISNTPGSGVLNVGFGQTINGELTISNQSYSAAETIYLRVTEAGGATRPTVGYSAELLVSSSLATPTMTPTITLTPQTANETPTPTPTSTPTPTATPWLMTGKVMNYPNPAKDQVNFAYTISGSANVTINIYQLTGERVASITEHVNGGAGQTQSTVWNAIDVAPGIYIALIKITDPSGKVILSEKKKVALIR